MSNNRPKLRGVRKLLPWLGLGVFVGSPLARVLNESCGPFIKLPQPEQRQTISGSFDTVVIDPGHGGQDSGASSHNLTEKVVTLDLGVRLAQELQKLGFKTLLTRDEDTYLSLADRVAFAKTVPDAIFVSLHCNFTSDPAAKGIEIYRCSQKSATEMMFVKFGGTEESLDRAEERLAQYLCDSVVQTIHSEMRGAKSANFFVVRNLDYPAVLVESGFLTNGEDARRLATPAYRQQLAGSLAGGIEMDHSIVSDKDDTSMDGLHPTGASQ